MAKAQGSKLAAKVIDTNVAVVANGRSPQADRPCVQACSDALAEARQRGPVLLDGAGLIFAEYRRNLSLSGQPGVGDAFVKWLWERQADERWCRRVDVTPHDHSFVEFPDDPDLRTFDPADRVFVAVAVASGLQPAILNAVDPGWWDHRQALARYVELRFLCPHLLDRTAER